MANHNTTSESQGKGEISRLERVSPDPTFDGRGSSEGKVDDVHRDRNDGDMGAQWLAGYTGPRREISDSENNSVRWKVCCVVDLTLRVRANGKIDRWLIPITFYIYFW